FAAGCRSTPPCPTWTPTPTPSRSRPSCFRTRAMRSTSRSSRWRRRSGRKGGLVRETSMLHVRLNPGLPGGQSARVRPLCGHDEAGINGAGAVEVVSFLDRLLSETPGTTVGPGKGADLAVCDCDRVCAAIYVKYFGERISGTAACRDCH